MQRKITIACVIGTRPEVIKVAPIIYALKQQDVAVYIINTAQHRELLDDMLRIFDIQPNTDLNVMQVNQTLGELTGNLFIKMDKIFSNTPFDFVLVQGDTTTTLVAAQLAFYHRIPFGHIEAGLRSYDLYQPLLKKRLSCFLTQKNIRLCKKIFHPMVMAMLQKELLKSLCAPKLRI